MNIAQLFYLLIAVMLTMGLIWNINANLPKFPGDIYLDKAGFRIYIPFTSAIIISVALTLLLNFLRR